MFDTDPVIQATERTRFSSVTESPRHATEENVTFDKTSSYQKERGLVNNTLPFNASDYVDGCCSGLTMDLLMELMKDLNFDIDLYEAPDGLWGAWTPEGWNGVIRVLMDNQADMAVTSLKITPNRSQQIDFSVPFLETGIAITVALREGAISPTAFLKPYDYQSWCMILIFSVHASGAALFIFEWLSPNGLNRGQMSTSEHRFTLFRSLWLIWSMLFGAAVNADNPRGVASRFLANIWALFALVFLASYTANLAAFMIAKEDFYDLSGMNDWRLQQPWNVKPPFRFSTIPSGATEENIKINFPEMGAYMRNFNRSTVEEGLASLKSGELDAFIYDANVLDYWASKDEGCKLRIVGNLYAMTGYGIGFAKGSRWLEKVNSRILDYQKNGKLQRWKKFWQTGSCRKDSALGNTNKTLGVKNFISAFILLLCGILLCSLILGFEHIVYRTIGSHVRRKIWKNCCSVKPMPFAITKTSPIFKNISNLNAYQGKQNVVNIFRVVDLVIILSFRLALTPHKKEAQLLSGLNVLGRFDALQHTFETGSFQLFGVSSDFSGGSLRESRNQKVTRITADEFACVGRNIVFKRMEILFLTVNFRETRVIVFLGEKDNKKQNVVGNADNEDGGVLNWISRKPPI
ncbi:Ligand-gated ion channel [Opisthorchis viverrini]|uniref:Ligand-gated ion channel n=1 Tax=Opisthorchis viverrini TaxID=6198 RepID=A0A1S8X3W1_OPIVI|nr:Ligand-gated ion channel [Opisthorchis viverrini]